MSLAKLVGPRARASQAPTAASRRARSPGASRSGRSGPSSRRSSRARASRASASPACGPRPRASMRFSVGQYTTPRLTFAEDLAVYREAGRRGHRHRCRPEAPRRRRGPRAPPRQRVAGDVLHAPDLDGLRGPIDKNLTDPVARVDAMCDAVREIARFDPVCVVLGTGPFTDPATDRPFAVESLRRAVRLAAELGQSVALEPLHTSLGPEWSYLTDLPGTLRLIEDIGEPDVGILFDVWHLWDSPTSARSSPRTSTPCTACTSTTGARRPAAGPTACSPATGSPTPPARSRSSARAATTGGWSSRCSPTTASWAGLPRLALARGPRPAHPARTREHARRLEHRPTSDGSRSPASTPVLSDVFPPLPRRQRLRLDRRRGRLLRRARRLRRRPAATSSTPRTLLGLGAGQLRRRVGDDHRRAGWRRAATATSRRRDEGRPAARASRACGAETIREAAEDSLRRLRHRPHRPLLRALRRRDDVPLEETLGAFDELVRRARSRDDRRLELLRARGSPRRSAISDREGLRALRRRCSRTTTSCERDDYEGELRGALRARGARAAFPYFSLARGLPDRQVPAGRRPTVDSAAAPRAPRSTWTSAARGCSPPLDEVAAAHGTTVAAVALAWLARAADRVAPIASARTPEQLADLLADASRSSSPTTSWRSSTPPAPPHELR